MKNRPREPTTHIPPGIPRKPTESESEGSILESRLPLGIHGHWVCFLFFTFGEKNLSFLNDKFGVCSK